MPPSAKRKAPDPRRRSFFVPKNDKPSDKPDYVNDRNKNRRVSTNRAQLEHLDELKTPSVEARSRERKKKRERPCPAYPTQEFKPSDDVTTLKELCLQILQQEEEGSKKTFQGKFAFVSTAVSSVVQTIHGELRKPPVNSKAVPRASTQLLRQSVQELESYSAEANSEIQQWEIWFAQKRERESLAEAENKRQNAEHKHNDAQILAGEPDLCKDVKNMHNHYSIQTDQLIRSVKTINEDLKEAALYNSAVSEVLNQRAIAPSQDTRGFLRSLAGSVAKE